MHTPRTHCLDGDLYYIVEGGPSVTRGGYLLTQWNMATLLVGGLL